VAGEDSLKKIYKGRIIVKTAKKNYIFIVDHIPANTPYNRRPGLPLVPEYITVHSTGNPGSTARQERAWLINPANKRTASWHICIDEREAVEAIPLGEVAWHAGDGGNGPGNRKSIAIEICESGDRVKTLENAAELVAELLRRLNLGTERLRRHWDWSGKACPRILMADNWAGWEKFKLEVEKRLNNPESTSGSTNLTGTAKPKNPANLTNTGSKPAVRETLPQIQHRVEGTLDGRPLKFEAYLINNTTYVPLRPLIEALGLQLKWMEGKYHIVTAASNQNK
jgi:N-acetylmuramoyl-L-alanine amidase